MKATIWPRPRKQFEDQLHFSKDSKVGTRAGIILSRARAWLSISYFCKFIFHTRTIRPTRQYGNETNLNAIHSHYKKPSFAQYLNSLNSSGHGKRCLAHFVLIFIIFLLYRIASKAQLPRNQRFLNSFLLFGNLARHFTLWLLQ